MVANSSVAPLGSPPDRAIPGVARVNGTPACSEDPTLGGGLAVADRDARSTAQTLQSAPLGRLKA